MRFTGSDDYVATDDLMLAVNAAITLERPLLIKGEPGTGKTVLAFEVAKALGLEMITWHVKSTTKAQHGLYEYDAVSRLRDSQLGEARVADVSNYIRKGKMWQAFEAKGRVVLLIDEIDRADEEFEAYLLEILADFQITVPELGTLKAVSKPIVVLTANGTRDLSDALRRRCLYTYVDYPDRETELAILNSRCPNIEAKLAEQIIGFVQKLRAEDLEKNPGIAETLDFAAALMGLGIADLTANPAALQASLTTLLKTQSDQAHITREVAQRLAGRAA